MDLHSFVVQMKNYSESSGLGWNFIVKLNYRDVMPRILSLIFHGLLILAMVRVAERELN